MRSLEILLLVITSLLLLLLLIKPNISKRLLAAAVVVLLLCLISHLVFEGCRWQMIPIYLVAICVATASIFRLISKEPSSVSNFKRVILALIGFAGLFIGLFLGVALPITKLPIPTGPYGVGTTTLLLVDEDREEIYSADLNDRREFMLQLWYPVNPEESAEISQYVTNLDIAGPALADRLDLPQFLLGHLDLIKTNSLIDAPISSEGAPFPLILFSHGLMGIRMQNTFMMEELASNGFVVASPDHTYDAVFTVMPDERVIFHDSQAIFPESESRIDSGTKLLDVRQEDLSAIISQMGRLNQEAGSPFYNRIDLGQIVYTGHSTGGGTVVSACLVDDRCDAIIALDSWLEPVSGGQPVDHLEVPALYLNSAEWLGLENKEIGREFAAEADAPAVVVTIEGANHNDFTDIPLLSPLARFIGLAGTINSQRVHQMINEYSLTFLEQVLGGETDTFNERFFFKFPEANVEIH